MSPSLFRRPLVGLVAAWILAWLPAAPAVAADSGPSAARSPTRVTALVEAGSFAADALAVRERKIPILVFYTRHECPWCERVRRQYLLPMANDPAWADRVIIREIDVGTDFVTPLTDFGGRTTTHSAFARTRRVKLVPTLDFLDDRGNRLAEPIVGMRTPDFYAASIERALEESLAKLGHASK